MDAELRQEQVPADVILLDMLSDVADAKDHFGPVPFDHAGHAKWAEIAGGCEVCHHYTPATAQHPKCVSCHEVAYRHEDISKPGLKGAYHRQCMGCHREWTHSTKCATCPRAACGRVRHDNPSRPRSRPTTRTSRSRSRMSATTRPGMPMRRASWRSSGTRSTRSVLALRVPSVHRGDTCARCHDSGGAEQPKARPPGKRHATCVACHDVEDEGKCAQCHYEAGQAEPPRFVHESTGWPLSRYHVDKSCRGCHKDVPFAKLERECNVCHESWAPDTFDHAVTGQKLDENHIENDCGDCHVDRKFDVPPSCTECHDEDENINFPAKRPGPLADGVKPKTPTPAQPAP